MSKKTENQKVNCLTETDQIKIQIDQEALKVFKDILKEFIYLANEFF